jgi:ParB-like chromosome segregation protein Spo0J
MSYDFGEYSVHPAADLFPMMPEDQFEALVEDIRSQGLRENITLLAETGEILDGRNRYQACIAAGVEPQFSDRAERNPVTFVLTKNLHRRHLTPSQRAAVAVDALPMYEAEAAERRAQAARRAANERPRDESGKLIQDKENLPEPGPKINAPQATDEVASTLQVSGRQVRDAKKIKAEDPELFEEVKAGELTVNAAKNQLNTKTPSIESVESKAAKQAKALVKKDRGYAEALWNALEEELN